MFYSYLRSKRVNKSSVIPLKEDDKVISSDGGMATILNNFFTTVFTIENDNLPEPMPCKAPEHLVDLSFPEDTISAKINRLKPDSAFGPDVIGPRILQASEDVMCLPLSIVFRKSLEEGVVPEDNTHFQVRI